MRATAAGGGRFPAMEPAMGHRLVQERQGDARRRSRGEQSSATQLLHSVS
jgi:hypothetical protein